MENNSKLTHESTHASLPENRKHPKIYTSRSKVKLQNEFYNELLKINKPPNCVPEEGEIVEIFKIPKNIKKHGSECNLSDTPLTSPKLDHLWSELVHLELHHFEKNCGNSDKMPKKKVKPGELNNTWIITHCPRPNQGSYLCDICGISFTFKGALVRHEHAQ